MIFSDDGTVILGCNNFGSNNGENSGGAIFDIDAAIPIDASNVNGFVKGNGNGGLFD